MVHGVIGTGKVPHENLKKYMRRRCWCLTSITTSAKVPDQKLNMPKASASLFIILKLHVSVMTIMTTYKS